MDSAPVVGAHRAGRARGPGRERGVARVERAGEDGDVDRLVFHVDADQAEVAEHGPGGVGQVGHPGDVGGRWKREGAAGRREQAGGEGDAGGRGDAQLEGLIVARVGRVQEPRRGGGERRAVRVLGAGDVADAAGGLGERKAVTDAAPLGRAGGQAEDRIARGVDPGGDRAVGPARGDLHAREEAARPLDPERLALGRDDHRLDREIARPLARRDVEAPRPRRARRPSGRRRRRPLHSGLQQSRPASGAPASGAQRERQQAAASPALRAGPQSACGGGLGGSPIANGICARISSWKARNVDSIGQVGALASRSRARVYDRSSMATTAAA